MQQSIHANIAEPFQSNSHCLSYDSQEELQFATKDQYPIDSIVHVSTDKPDDEEYSNDNQSYTEEYPFADDDQPYADQPYVAENLNDLLLDEEQPYSQDDDQSYTEEYPFADEGQPYADQPYVAENLNGLLLDEEQPYSQDDDQSYTEEYPGYPFAHESIQMIHLFMQTNFIQIRLMLQNTRMIH